MNQIITKPNHSHINQPHPQEKKWKIEISNEITEIPILNHQVSNSYKKYSNKLNTISNFHTSYFKNHLFQNRYQLQFYISLAVAIIFVSILFFNIYTASQQEKIAKDLLNNYNLTTLYHQESETTGSTNNLSQTSISYQNPFVIGMIRIPTINLNYPILSESNSDLLKISLCRFAGPMPNEIGNLCIAGHNYVDNRFFSRLNELENDDIVEIYDLNGNHIDYIVFDKFEVEDDDLSCTNQDVGENRILTLLTCNNVNGKRTIVKAKETVS